MTVVAMSHGELSRYDTLLQVAFHSRMAEQAGHFSLQDVIDGITAKMIRRHPHVFGEGLAREEFAAFLSLREKLAMTSYFCMPSAPWQKNSVENSNGRIRRFLPLDTDITLVSDNEFQALVDRLNNTPRKCLDYRTPKEVLGE